VNEIVGQLPISKIKDTAGLIARKLNNEMIPPSIRTSFLKDYIESGKT